MYDQLTYPTWPFTRLKPQQMAAFEKRQRRADADSEKVHQQKRKEELANELGEATL